MKLPQPTTECQPKGKKRQIRFPNIGRHAHLLGVTRSHLYRVLVGERVSTGLVDRYRQLQGKGEQP